MSIEPLTLGFIGCGLLILLCVLGVRFAYAAAIVGAFGLAMLTGWGAGLRTAGVVPHASVVNYTLSVLPMFILIGYLAYYAGITQAAFEAARRWLGWLPGGLAIATVYAVAGFSAVSGANTAAAAVFAKVAIPEMLKAKLQQAAGGRRGRGRRHARFADPAQRAAGRLRHHHRAVDRQAAGRGLRARHLLGASSTPRSSWSCAGAIPSSASRIRGYTWPQRFKSLPGTLPIVLVIADHLLQHAVRLGDADRGGRAGRALRVRHRAGQRHECAASCAAPARYGAAHGGDLHGDLGRADLRALPGLRRPAGGARALGHRPQRAADLRSCWRSTCIYFILGTMLEGIGMFLLTLPVVFPVIEALGYDPIWFGIILVKLNGIATLSPPVGLVVFVVNGVRPDISVRRHLPRHLAVHLRRHHHHRLPDGVPRDRDLHPRSRVAGRLRPPASGLRRRTGSP